jgi:hypothetical protein
MVSLRNPFAKVQRMIVTIKCFSGKVVVDMEWKD